MRKREVCWGCARPVMIETDSPYNTCPHCSHMVGRNELTCICSACVNRRHEQQLTGALPAPTALVVSAGMRCGSLLTTVTRHGATLTLTDMDNPKFTVTVTLSRERLLAIVSEVALAEERYARGETS